MLLNDGEAIVTDWDAIFSQQINIDSFNGWLRRKKQKLDEVIKHLEPELSIYRSAVEHERKVRAKTASNVKKVLDRCE